MAETADHEAGYVNRDIQETAVPIQVVVDFLTEFNANATIFNEILLPMMLGVQMNSYIAGRAHILAEANSRLWTENIPEMRSQLATLMLIAGSSGSSNVDDPDFQDCAHTADGDCGPF